MLLDKPNIELLRLVAQCKDFPISTPFPDLFLLSAGNAGRLREEKLLSISRDGRRYRMAKAGYTLLDAAGIDYPPERYRENDAQMLTRREQSALVSLTLLLAGADVYANDLTQVQERVYLSAGNIRRIHRSEGRNLAGNTRFAGITAGYLFYYMADPQDALFFKQETRLALTLLAQTSSGPAVTRPAVIYMGNDYPALCAAVTAPLTAKATYRSAYDKFDMPVHLCPCNPDGAFQMRIMLQTEYRERIIAAMMSGNIIPNPFYPGCDGTMKGEPFILGLDMDLRRITGMIKAARMGGVKSHIFVRSCQCEALQALFPETDIVFYVIEDSELQSIFSFSTLLAEPPIEPYITKEGEYIHDETIRACREARKAHRKKGKASQKED